MSSCQLCQIFGGDIGERLRSTALPGKPQYIYTNTYYRTSLYKHRSYKASHSKIHRTMSNVGLNNNGVVKHGTEFSQNISAHSNGESRVRKCHIDIYTSNGYISITVTYTDHVQYI